MDTGIFQTLSQIDVSGYTKSKNGATYLPWASCWKLVMDHFPHSTYKIHTQHISTATESCSTSYERPWFADTTGWVEVEVCIRNDNECATHTEIYPIMDFRNKSIPASDITTMDVNKALKRALVKAVASCTGLGLFLFYGEDLPSEMAEIVTAQEKVSELANKKAKLSDAAKEKVTEIMRKAEKQTNPSLEDDLITGRAANINDIDVLKDVEKKLLAIRK